MTYEVRFSKRVKLAIDRIQASEKGTVKERIDELAQRPRAVGKPLLGPFRERNVWSSRVGDLRILYSILEHEKIVLVIRLDHRRRVYRI